jgi:hypothetical protein
MSNSLRSSLIVLAALAMTANVKAAGKGRPPAHHPAPKAPSRVSHTMAAAKGHRSAPRHAGKAPRQVSHSKVSSHRRPAVHRRPAQAARRSNTSIKRQSVRRNNQQSVRRNAIRTMHRYPVHRVQRRALVRMNSPTRFSRQRRYTYSYYPGRYVWRSNYYGRGLGSSRRGATRGIRGVVESVQGNAVNGTLLVKAARPRSSRFRFASVARRGTSMHRFALNNATRYEVLAVPRRGGTIADLHKGEHVMVLTHPRAAHQAQKIQLSPLRKR